ncbi:hypothetical protein JXA40_02065 [bacterium]|nr:hypothetical protein [candidate division CSSED10-310 bacterium]
MGMPRTTIVGGRPPGQKDTTGKIPVGMEQLVHFAAQSGERHEQFLNDPLGFADQSGIVLDPCERAILQVIEKDQLRMFVEQVRPRIPERRQFIKQAAGLIGVFSVGLSGSILPGKARAALGLAPGALQAGQTGRKTRKLVSAGILPRYQGRPPWLPIATNTPTPTDTPTPAGTQPPTSPPPTPTDWPTPTQSPFPSPTGIPTPPPTSTWSTPTPAGIMTETPTPRPPSSTPTRTVTPAGTMTGTPTATPTVRPWTPTGTPTPVGIMTETPTPSPSPTLAQMGVYIDMPSHFYRPGDPCKLKVNICNPGTKQEDIPLFIVLQIGSMFYCAPDWDEASYYRITLPWGWTSLVIIDEFNWPGDVGTMDNLFFWGGMTSKNFDEALGHVDSWKFGYGE